MLFILLSLLIAGANAGSYLISAPSNIQRGSIYDITVDILNTTGVEVEATLQDRRYNGTYGRYDIIPLLNASGTFGLGTTGTLSMAIPSDTICTSCQVHIRGRGGLQFERTLNSYLSSDVVATMVQTDKAIYKPGQTVRFRTFAVYPDLQLYSGDFNVEIRDPNNNKVKVMNGLNSQTGVVEGTLDLSEQPLFGAWSITVALEEVNDVYTQTFDVADYELPRFEVTVDLSPYALTSDTVLAGSVKAEYTFGQPVKGMVELHVGPNQGPNSCGDLPRTTQISFEIDGEADFTIPKDDIQRAVRIYDNTEVRVTAFVKEAATGVRLNGSSVITFYSREHKVEFTDNTPNVFKPGLPYTAFVHVTTPDDMPPTGTNNIVSVYTYVTYELTVDDQSLYSISQFQGSYPLPGQNVSLPANGLLPVDIDIPTNATSISIKATFKGVSATKSVDKMYSQSNNFIQVSLLDKNVKAKDTITFKVDGTEALNAVSYEVLARGSVAFASMLDGQGQNSFTFDLQVTASMAPTAHLLVYYARGSDEIVADSLAFNVDGIFQNEVTIAFSKNESEPAEQVDVVVTADANSEIYLLAVDQSVLLLKSGNDVTPDKVSDAVSKFDKGDKPSDSEFALSYSAESVSDVFSQTGLVVITDVDMTKPNKYDSQTFYRFGGGPPPLPGPPGQWSPMGRSGQHAMHMEGPPLSMQEASLVNQPKAVERIRNLFPETWLWTSAMARSDGRATITTTVPDTITSWVASAFATHATSGLGVAPTTAKLKVFRPFFVSLTYPNSVVNGERVVIQATVFNYLPGDADVSVTLKGSSKFQTIKSPGSNLETLESGDQVLSVSVPSEKQGVVYFPILTTDIGVVDIEVLAQSTQAADGVRRQILVEPEGAPVSFNYPVFINIDANASRREFDDTIAFPLPSSVVLGSDKARVKVTGDLIGSSLDSLTSLLALPTGCGEQSMVKFSPDLHIARYLKATGQLTEAVSRKIVSLLEAGYQRQMTYQRSDGGFSAFGNLDESGSTWLTAFVSRDVSVAREFIYVDPNMLVRAVDWLVNRQNKDGSFNEFGQVLDRNMQGTGTGPALTAFVLLSLIQNADLSGEQECLINSYRCTRFYQWGNATANAVANLESLVANDAINDQFALSVVSYALTRANSKQADVAFNKLLTYGNFEGNLLYWSDNATVSSQSRGSGFLTWQPPRIQARPIDILITSYAILTYTEQNRIDEGFAPIRWLTTQRNSMGGFASTQDTTVGLQALAEYATKSIRPDTALNIKITNQGPLAEFNIDKQNALILQIQELSSVPSQATIRATGTGFALVEMDFSLNVDDELTTPSFDVSTVLLDDDIDSFNLMVCTKYLWDRDTGMVVQEIRIPSGFQPDLTSLDNVAGLKKAERKGDTVDVYFDKVSKTSICYSIMMTRSAKVASSQKSYVRTYDYYEPSDQSTVFWQPRKLRDSTICDVCDGCCP